MESENAALPHGSGTDKTLKPPDFALFDCTASLHGYWSDVTRVRVQHLAERNKQLILADRRFTLVPNQCRAMENMECRPPCPTGRDSYCKKQYHCAIC